MKLQKWWRVMKKRIRERVSISKGEGLSRMIRVWNLWVQSSILRHNPQYFVDVVKNKRRTKNNNLEFLLGWSGNDQEHMMTVSVVVKQTEVINILLPASYMQSSYRFGRTLGYEYHIHGFRRVLCRCNGRVTRAWDLVPCILYSVNDKRWVSLIFFKKKLKKSGFIDE